MFGADCRLAFWSFGGLILLLLVRLFERPIFGTQRPITPHITQFVCRNAFRILGIHFATNGTTDEAKKVLWSLITRDGWISFRSMPANGCISCRNPRSAGWPGIGWLARATGTVFINRDRKEAQSQIEVFRTRLMAGHKLLFFPEGTSSDSQRVLPFKSTLFAAFFTPDLRDFMWVQPVTIRYFAPEGHDPRFYGWWGDMEFGPHLLQTLAVRRQGRVELVYHAPVKVSDFKGRKELAAHCEAAIREGLGDLNVER